MTDNNIIRTIDNIIIELIKVKYSLENKENKENQTPNNSNNDASSPYIVNKAKCRENMPPSENKNITEISIPNNDTCRPNVDNFTTHKKNNSQPSQLYEKIDNLIYDDDIILNKRIQLHKQSGTYVGFNNPEKQVQSEDKNIERSQSAEKIAKYQKKENCGTSKSSISSMTLLKLKPSERNLILKQVYDDALFKVKHVESINENDPKFMDMVMREADILLEKWVKTL